MEGRAKDVNGKIAVATGGGQGISEGIIGLFAASGTAIPEGRTVASIVR